MPEKIIINKMTDDIMDGKDMINLNMKGGEFGNDTIMQQIIRNQI